MPDISMCQNDDCTLAHRCRRSTKSGTVPTPGWQAYSVFGPKDSVDCAGWWKWPPKDSRNDR